jgi:hypothetical protein
MKLRLIILLSACLPALGATVSNVSSNTFKVLATSYTNLAKFGTNVIAFGADPTGVADSTAAFQSALAANKYLKIPRGIYKVNLLINSLVHLEGEDIRGTQLIPATNSIPILIYAGSSTNGKNGVVRNITLNGRSGAGTTGLQVGNGTGTSGTTIFDNIIIVQCKQYGMILNDSTQNMFHMIDIQDGGTGSIGIFVDNESSVQLNTFINCLSRQNGIGGKFGSGNRMTFINCRWESNFSTGTQLHRRVSSGIANSVFIENWWENNGITPDTNNFRAEIFFSGEDASSVTNASNLVFEGGVLNSATNVLDIFAEIAQGVEFRRTSFTLKSRGGFSTNKFNFADTGKVYIRLTDCGELNTFPTPEIYTNFPALKLGGVDPISTLNRSGFIYEFKYQARKYSNRPPHGIAGAPFNASLMPGFIGELIKDSSNNALYVATGTTTNDWLAVGLGPMTKAQRDAIVVPREGMKIDQTDATPGPRVYVGGAWQRINITADP